MNMRSLPSHNLKIVLFQPQIAPNTGNIARLCVATGAELHLVRPLGFVLSDRQLRRSAMDYWPRLRLTLHDENEGFFRAIEQSRFWLFSTTAQRLFWEADSHPADYLIFGSETHGLPEPLLKQHSQHALRLPQSPGERCLNLSTAAGVVLYEAMRQLASCGKDGPL